MARHKQLRDKPGSCHSQSLPLEAARGQAGAWLLLQEHYPAPPGDQTAQGISYSTGAEAAVVSEPQQHPHITAQLPRAHF